MITAPRAVHPRIQGALAVPDLRCRPAVQGAAHQDVVDGAERPVPVAIVQTKISRSTP
jgi:hypothetical protein